MTIYYDIIDKLTSMLLEDENINTCTNGLIDEVAMNKHTTYALAHFMFNNISIGNSTTVGMTLYVMDIVYENKETDDDNLDDVLNTQLAVVMRFIERLRRGDVRLETYALTGTNSLIPFKERFEDEVAGWELSFTIEVPNTMTIC